MLSLCIHSLPLHGLGKAWSYGAKISHDQRPSATCAQIGMYGISSVSRTWSLAVRSSRKPHTKALVARPREPGFSTPKVKLHPKKVILSVWWNYKAVIHRELLPGDGAIAWEHIFVENASTHCERDSEKAQSFGWHLLALPPSSLDPAPADCHLLLSLSNNLH